MSRRRGTRTTRPDRLWVADITYEPTWTGFAFLAIVLDVFSRKVVGWAMANHLRSEPVLAALNMAIAQRRPLGVIPHSDKGAQYTSLAFGKRCRDAAVVASTGSAGDCSDNAMAESFFVPAAVHRDHQPPAPRNARPLARDVGGPMQPRAHDLRLSPASLRGLIKHVPRTQRYAVTEAGVRVGLCYPRVFVRVLRPALTHASDEPAASSSPLNRLIRRFDHEIQRPWVGMPLTE